MTLSYYVHIPYCARRCGYCDFNTYVPSELKEGASLDDVSRDYIDAVLLELEGSPRDRVSTIFFGGGTPTLLPPEDLGRVISLIRERNGLENHAEITVEANPDSVDASKLRKLRAAGFNRISLGMQSTTPHVLKTLDRTHNPESVARAVTDARSAGFESISVDLIYATPGESLDEWRSTIESAMALDIDHISAYSLIVEEGTRLAAQIKRGEVGRPDDDLAADMYTLADTLFQQRGFDWYELSNWSKPGHQSRHNIAYWRNEQWWGLGPGAHSHIGNERFWNIKNPLAYKQRIFGGESVIAEKEILTEQQQRDEEVMLAIRLREGLLARPDTAARLNEFVASGHMSKSGDRYILTLHGRLIADRIVRELLG